jgi:hypothetical protein
MSEHDSKPKHESVVYLGMNDASREKEKAAFAGMQDATVITGSGTNQEMQGKLMSTDGKTVLDLSNEADMERFLHETGVDSQRTDKDGKATETPEQAKARMAALEDLFMGQRDEHGQRSGGINEGARDEMGQFLQVLQKVEHGDMTMDRLVMSGHSTGNWVYSEADGNPGVTFEQMGSLMGQFPQAQAGVHDLMLSACHTLENSQWGDTRDGKQYTDMFPELQSVWGYNGTSPSYKQGSTQHIKNWLAASDGDHPDRVVQMAKATGQNAKGMKY